VFYEFPDQNLIAHIRQHPEMYVANRALGGLHGLVLEALVYSLKEALSKNCTQLTITLDYDQQVIIEDNSPGIDTRIITQPNLTFLEIKLTKRSTDHHQGMEAHPLYGVGLPVVNALSESFTVEVRREGYLWRQEYCYGEKQTPVMRVRLLAPNERNGLTLRFKPDFEIFDRQNFDYALLRQRLREIAFLVPDLAITLKDDRIGLRDHLHYPDGLRGFLRFLNRGHIVIHTPIYGTEEIETLSINSWSYTVRVEFAFQYVSYAEGFQEIFVNTVKSTNATALRALRAVLLWTLNRTARQHGWLGSSEPDFSIYDINYGLTTIISIYHLYTSTGKHNLSQMLQQNTWDAALRATVNSLNLMERHRPETLRAIAMQMIAHRHS
jgi:DNA gyrase subunit B